MFVSGTPTSASARVRDGRPATGGTASPPPASGEISTSRRRVRRCSGARSPASVARWRGVKRRRGGELRSSTSAPSDGERRCSRRRRFLLPPRTAQVELSSRSTGSAPSRRLTCVSRARAAQTRARRKPCWVRPAVCAATDRASSGGLLEPDSWRGDDYDVRESSPKSCWWCWSRCWRALTPAAPLEERFDRCWPHRQARLRAQRNTGFRPAHSSCGGWGRAAADLVRCDLTVGREADSARCDGAGDRRRMPAAVVLPQPPQKIRELA